KEEGRTEDLKAAQAGSVAGSPAAAGLEEGLWLCPVEDRRRLDSSREGMLEGFSLGNYVLLNETAPRWENHSHSASLRPPCFALASCQQPLAQTAPLARATNLRIKANRVPPPPGFVQE